MEIFVHKDGRQQGPYTLEQLRNFLSTGAFAPGDLCWHQGMSQWQPVSSLISSGLPAEQIPTAAAPAGQTDPLSVWSLVLGILSWLCFSILSGIPAVICGHKSLGRIRKNPVLQGRGMAIAGLVLGYGSVLTFIPLLAVVSAISIPSIVGATENAKAARSLNDARQIHVAMASAALDSFTTGKKSTSWPADAGLRSVAEVRQMLVANDYLSEETAGRLAFENFLIGNVSEDDPEDTILLKSRPAPGKPSIVFQKSGEGAIYRPGQTEAGTTPPRDPPFLE